MNREQTRKSERGTRNDADRLRALNVPHRVEVELAANGLPIGMRYAGCEMSRSVEAVGKSGASMMNGGASRSLGNALK